MGSLSCFSISHYFYKELKSALVFTPKALDAHKIGYIV